MKLVWIKWFFRDWLSETTVTRTSLAARGLWREALDVMTDRHTYKLEGTREQLAMDLRCSVAELSSALPNLKASGIGDVTLLGNGYVTLLSRRLERELSDRENGRKRVAEHRLKRRCNGEGNANVPSGSGSSESVKVGGPGEGNARGVGAFHQLRGEIWAYYRRPESQRAGYEEEHLLAEISRSPSALDEWNTIRSSPHGFKRQSVLTLLQNWAGELDKARNYQPPPLKDRNGNPIKQTNMLMPKMSKVEREAM